jgi:hypothetical protein
MEYTNGLRLCPGADTVDARMNAALSTRDRFRLFRLVSFVIGLPFWSVGWPMRPFGCIFRQTIFRDSSETVWSLAASIRMERYN